MRKCQISRGLKAAISLVAAVAQGALAFPSVAEPFCDNLRVIAAAAPGFTSLRGEAVGMEFHGTLVLEGASQCEVRNKSDLGADWQPVNDKWLYECLWENRTDDAFPAFTGMLKMCLPEAKLTHGSASSRRFRNFIGNTFRMGDVSFVEDYNKDTHQLWLIVLPKGVMP